MTSKPKICLVNPPDIFSSHFPFGLGYIAGELLESGFEVEIIDFVSKQSSDISLQNSIIERLRKSDIKIIGLTGMSHNYQWLRELSLKIKSSFEDVYIIAGGHWAYHEPEIILKHTGVDIIINGEGDYVVKDVCHVLLERGALVNVKGITFKDNGEFVSTGPAPLIKNLDTLPFPPYELFNIKKYITSESWVVWKNSLKEYYPTISMQSGRGCIGKCMFCTGERQVFRKHSPSYVVKHIKFIIQKYGIGNIRFKEALTLGDKRWIEEFCGLLMADGIKIKYECISRVDTINEQIVKLLSRSGCYKIQFGIESGDDAILSEIAQKNISSQIARQAIRLCKKNNIIPAGGFIIGLPTETIRSLNKTLYFILTTQIEETGATFPTPFPGTRLFEIALRRFGIEKESLFSDSSLMNYNEDAQDQLIAKYNFTDLSPETLKFYRFLFNEAFLINRLRRMRKYSRLIIELFIYLELKLISKLKEKLLCAKF